MLELTDEQFQRAAKAMSLNTKRRRKHDLKTIMSGAAYVIRNGTGWRDLPARFGPWQTVFYYFNDWRRSGKLDALVEAVESESVEVLTN